MVSDQVKDQVFAQLGCQSSEARLLGGYDQHVFEVIHCGKPMVVKIMDGAMTSESSVLSECEWLENMLKHGLRVVKPLQLAGDTAINRISDDIFYVVYEKVEGIHVSPQDQQWWNNSLFEKWGEMMGRMHALAKTFHPRYPRPQWSNQRLFQEEIAGVDQGLLEKWNRYYQDFLDVQKLPQTKEHFGLIHGDLHAHNFLLKDGQLTIIDFGDSEYNWFAYDIAIAVYHTAQTVPKGPARKEFVMSFFQSFMEGYTRSNAVTVADIEYFIDYRQLYSYLYHTVFADKSQWTEKQVAYLENMRLSLHSGESFLGFTLS